MLKPKSPQAGTVIAGGAYELGPAGSNFEPPITLSIKYNTALIPEGVSEKDVFIATWDEDKQAWIPVDSTVDMEKDIVSTKVSHFSIYTVLVPSYKVAPKQEPTPAPAPTPTTTLAPTLAPAPAPLPLAAPKPASFIVSGLTVDPGQVIVGEKTMVTITVANTGGSSGSYTVILKVNNVEEAKKEVSLEADKNEIVNFTITRDRAGIFAIDVNGKTGQFTVVIPQPVTPAPVAALPIETPTNWGHIGGIIAAGVIVVGSLAYFFVWRRRGKPKQSSA